MLLVAVKLVEVKLAVVELELRLVLVPVIVLQASLEVNGDVGHL